MDRAPRKSEKKSMESLECFLDAYPEMSLEAASNLVLAAALYNLSYFVGELGGKGEEGGGNHRRRLPVGGDPFHQRPCGSVPYKPGETGRARDAGRS